MTGPTADNALLSSPLSADPHHCSGIDDLAEPHERQHSLAHPAGDPHLDHRNAGGAPAYRRLLNRFSPSLIWLNLLSGIALVLREMAAIVFQA